MQFLLCYEDGEGDTARVGGDLEQFLSWNILIFKEFGEFEMNDRVYV